MTKRLSNLVDRLAHHEDRVRRWCLSAAALTFGAGLILFLLGQVWPGLPVPDRFVPTTFLSTIAPAFSIILLYELYVLTLATSGPFVSFVVREFEVISLIVVRELFKRLDELAGSFSAVLLTEVAVVAIGGLILYFLIEVLQRIETQYLAGDLKDELPGPGKGRKRLKDSLEVGMLVYFTAVAAYEGVGWLLGIPGTGFSDAFIYLAFGGLIVYSIALLLLVLIEAKTYELLFEYSALVLTAVLALIAFQAPIFIQVPMLIADILFIIAVLALHGFARGKRIKPLLRHAKNK